MTRSNLRYNAYAHTHTHIVVRHRYQRIFSAQDSGAAHKAVLCWFAGVVVLESSISLLALSGAVAALQGLIPDLDLVSLREHQSGHKHLRIRGLPPKYVEQLHAPVSADNAVVFDSWQSSLSLSLSLSLSHSVSPSLPPLSLARACFLSFAGRTKHDRNGNTDSSFFTAAHMDRNGSRGVYACRYRLDRRFISVGTGYQPRTRCLRSLSLSLSLSALCLSLSLGLSVSRTLNLSDSQSISGTLCLSLSLGL